MGFYKLTTGVPCSGLALPTHAPVRMSNQFDILTYDFDHDVQVVDVTFEFEFSCENDGIGAYEYCGQKGYDAGCNYLEIQKWDFSIKEWMPKNFVNFVSDLIASNIEIFDDYINDNPPSRDIDI